MHTNEKKLYKLVERSKCTLLRATTKSTAINLIPFVHMSVFVLWWGVKKLVNSISFHPTILNYISSSSVASDFPKVFSLPLNLLIIQQIWDNYICGSTLIDSDGRSWLYMCKGIVFLLFSFFYDIAAASQNFRCWNLPQISKPTTRCKVTLFFEWVCE